MSLTYINEKFDYNNIRFFAFTDHKEYSACLDIRAAQTYRRSLNPESLGKLSAEMIEWGMKYLDERSLILNGDIHNNTRPLNSQEEIALFKGIRSNMEKEAFMAFYGFAERTYSAIIRSDVDEGLYIGRSRITRN